MTKRRFHITEQQGQVVRLALAALLERIENEHSEFWIWVRATAIDLKTKLDNYEWRINK